MIMEGSLSACENSGIHIFSSRNLFDLEYAVYFVLLIEDHSGLQDILDRPIDGVCLGCVFHLCKMVLHDCIGSKPNLVLARKQLSEVDGFSCISPGGRIQE